MSQAIPYVFFGFEVFTDGVLSPLTSWFGLDPTATIELRPGDPVKQTSGGRLQRAAPGDSAILGFAATGSKSNIARAIGVAPVMTDSAGNPMICVYLANGSNIFRGATVATPATADILQAHDLQYAVPTGPVPTITPVGGSTSAYSYTVTAVTGVGESLVGTTGTTSLGAATLTASAYNTIAIAATPQAIKYNIYRTVASGTSPTTTGFIGSVVPATVGGAASFNDTGLAGNGVAAPVYNYSGWLINNTANSTGVLQVTAVDTTPIQPFINTAILGYEQFKIPAAKSQYGTVMGS